jgi:hypothetical protein
MKSVIRLRALISGLLIGVVLCGVTPFADSYLRTTPLAGGHFPLAAFFVLVSAMILLALLSRFTGRAPLLSGSELLVAWVLMVVVSGIGYTGLVRTFFINISAPAHFADAGNAWANTLLPLLPEALYPRDATLLDSLYHGLPDKTKRDFFSTIAAIPWAMWLPLLAQWTVFILLVYVALFCIANLFADQWVVNERLNFPLLQTPQMMAEAYDQGRLFVFLRDPYLLVGLSLPLMLHTLGGLAAHYPSVPALPIEILIGSYFPSSGPLAGFAKVKVYIYPAFIGFAFIATRQISLSFWLFFLLACLFSGLLQASGVRIADSALGTMFGPTILRPEETQVIGAGLVSVFFIVWLARASLRQALVGLFTGREEPSEAGWIPSRYALLGTVLSLTALCVWSMAWGMGLTSAVLLYLAFFMAMLVVARIVCQGGVPFCSLNTAPSDTILSLFGSRPLGSLGVVLGMSLQKMLFVDMRESLLPSLFHAEKIGERTRGRGALAVTVLLALVLAVAAAFFAMLYLAYRYGLQELDMDWATRTTQTVYANSKGLLETPQSPSHWVLLFVAIGAAVMIALILCFYLLPWWPIHPLGYLMAYSSSMRLLWFSFLVGWVCNALCQRYGGNFLYRRVRLVFIGMILGDFVMGAFWALISLRSGVSYLVLPS